MEENGKEKQHLEKLREKKSKRKKEGVGIAVSAHFSMKEMSFATEGPKTGAAPSWWAPLELRSLKGLGAPASFPSSGLVCDWHQFLRQSEGCQQQHRGAPVLGEPWQDVSPRPPHLSGQPASLPSDCMESEDTVPC